MHILYPAIPTAVLVFGLLFLYGSWTEREDKRYTDGIGHSYTIERCGECAMLWGLVGCACTVIGGALVIEQVKALVHAIFS